MERFFKLGWWIVLLIFIFADAIAAGMGMGVPVFCVLLGFPTGWYLARRHLLLHPEIKDALGAVLRDSLITSGITFLFMAVLWGRTIPMLFDPASDFANFGIPMILFDARLSFIGWLVLMIFISPFLELLTTVFAAYLTVIRRLRIKSRQG